MGYRDYQGHQELHHRELSSIRILIIITCLVSILSALTNHLFLQLFGGIGPQYLLAISWSGMQNYFFWQPLSYLFVQSNGAEGISPSFLLSLLFDMYILWTMGAILIERIGKKHFFLLYLIAGMAAALCALPFMSLTPYVLSSGPSASLFALLTVWAMLYPDQLVMLFLFIPMKVKWITGVALGAALVLALSGDDWISFSLYLTGALSGYLYGWLVLGLENQLIPELGRQLANLFNRLVSSKKTASRSPSQKNNKIFEFTTGEPVLDDEAFMDAMLAKISRHGEESLSISEKQRMRKISEKKIKKGP